MPGEAALISGDRRVATPERAYKYYIRYDGTTYGVLSDDGGKVMAESTGGGKRIRVSKKWVQEHIDSGKADISKNEEGFD